jgi:hypothetical protein
MTEAEWLASLDPQQVFQNLKGKPSARKFRLFATGCCRQFWDQLTDERSRAAVEFAERYADNEITSGEAMTVEGPADEVVDRSRPQGEDAKNDAAACAAVCLALWAPAHWGAFQPILWGEGLLGRSLLNKLLGCVFRVPYHRIHFHPTWRTDAVLGLARGIYEDRAFDRLPILADALQDAGCEDEAILGHCRGDGPHVRGCWVVDLVLGKES